MKTESEFTHRHNDDGTVDAICLQCYRTVGTAKTTEDLAESQRSHECAEDDLVLQRGKIRLVEKRDFRDP